MPSGSTRAPDGDADVEVADGAVRCVGASTIGRIARLERRLCSTLEHEPAAIDRAWELLSECGFGGMDAAIQTLRNAAMKVGRTTFLGAAEPGVRKEVGKPTFWASRSDFTNFAATSGLP